MSRFLVIPFFLVATSCGVPPEVTQLPCKAKGPLMLLSGPNRSISELEAEGLALAATNPNMPQVAFARASEAWLEVKANYQKGDTIRAFTTKGFKGRPHAAGYALSRDGCVVAGVVVSVAD
jgi:hypothetical protein